MNAIRQLTLICIACTLGLVAAKSDFKGVPSGAYSLDPHHGYILISYQHLGFSRPQIRFTRFDVKLQLNAANPRLSTLEVGIDAATVDSGIPSFDGHLKGPDWFHAAEYPQIQFASSSISRIDEDTYEVQGMLSIKDITRGVTLKAVLNKSGAHPMNQRPALGFSATAKLLRSEWGLGKYAPAVDDQISLDIQVELHLTDQ